MGQQPQELKTDAGKMQALARAINWLEPDKCDEVLEAVVSEYRSTRNESAAWIELVGAIKGLLDTNDDLRDSLTNKTLREGTDMAEQGSRESEIISYGDARSVKQVRVYRDARHIGNIVYHDHIEGCEGWFGDAWLESNGLDAYGKTLQEAIANAERWQQKTGCIETER